MSLNNGFNKIGIGNSTDDFWYQLGKKVLPSTSDILLGENLQNAIKIRLFQTIENDLLHYQEIAPPLLLKDTDSYVAHGRKIHIIPTFLVQKAIMKTREDHFELYINEGIYNNQDRIDSREIISHEIGHTYMFNIDCIPIESFLQKDEFFSFLRYHVNDFNRIEESFASEIGRRILIPNYLLKEFLPRKPSINGMLALMDKFEVSLSTIIYRLFFDLFYYENSLPCWIENIHCFSQNNYQIFICSNEQDVSKEMDFNLDLIQILIKEYENNTKAAPLIKKRTGCIYNEDYRMDIMFDVSDRVILCWRI